MLGVTSRVCVPVGRADVKVIESQVLTEMLQDKDVSDATYAAAIARFGEQTVLDIMCTSGYFGFVSVILNTIRAPVPEGGAVLN